MKEHVAYSGVSLMCTSAQRGLSNSLYWGFNSSQIVNAWPPPLSLCLCIRSKWNSNVLTLLIRMNTVAPLGGLSTKRTCSGTTLWRLDTKL